MEIKHQHPDYRSEEERRAQLKDTQHTCIGVVRQLRAAASKRKDRTA